MQPYFERDGITIYHRPAEDVLPTLEAGSVDLIVTDPPYAGAWKGGPQKYHGLATVEGHDGSCDVRSIVRLALRTLRRQRHIYVFGPLDLASLSECGGFCDLVWDKCIPNPKGGDTPWAPSHERIAFAVNTRSPVNTANGSGNGPARMRRGTVLRFPRRNGSAATGGHPTEKPVDLIRELIESSSRIGETVLDPFMGSGSTLVAAQIEGRRAIGIEVEERYCEIAARRLDQQVLAFAEPEPVATQASLLVVP